MQEAQQAMAVDPKNYVPINYASETPIMAVIANFAPTLLFIGALLFMSQRAAGQACPAHGWVNVLPRAQRLTIGGPRGIVWVPARPWRRWGRAGPAGSSAWAGPRPS